MAVTVVVDEAATGVPAWGAILRQPGLFGDIGEGAVAIVVIKHNAAVVGDDQVVEAIVVVVADAASLSPTGSCQPCLFGDVREGAISIVMEEKIGRLMRWRDALEPSAVDHEDVEPAVVVVIKERDAAAGFFEDVSLARDTAIHIQRCAEPRLDRNVLERKGWLGRGAGARLSYGRWRCLP